MVKVRPRLMWLRVTVAGIAFIAAGLALSSVGNAHAQTAAGELGAAAARSGAPAMPTNCRGVCTYLVNPITGAFTLTREWGCANLTHTNVFNPVQGLLNQCPTRVWTHSGANGHGPKCWDPHSFHFATGGGNLGHVHDVQVVLNRSNCPPHS